MMPPDMPSSKNAYAVRVHRAYAVAEHVYSAGRLALEARRSYFGDCSARPLEHLSPKPRRDTTRRGFDLLGPHLAPQSRDVFRLDAAAFGRPQLAGRDQLVDLANRNGEHLRDLWDAICAASYQQKDSVYRLRFAMVGGTVGSVQSA